jgi:hypothetical protein
VNIINVPIVHVEPIDLLERGQKTMVHEPKSGYGLFDMAYEIKIIIIFLRGK